MKRVVLSIMIIMLAVALMPMPSVAKEIELKLASWGPTQHFVATARNEWIAQVNKDLAGKLKIVDYPGGQLFGPSDVHKGIARGSVDMGVILQPAMLAMVPLVQGVYLPFAFDNWDQVVKAYSGESLAIIEKAMEKKRLKLVYVSYTDPVQIFSNKKNIAKVEDFKGLRMLSTSPIFTEIMAALGAAPDTSVPQTEQYMALKRGVSDSIANSIVGGYFQKSFEVAPYVTKANMSYSTILVAMNTKKWKSLPKDVQEYLLKARETVTPKTLAMAQGWETKFTGAIQQAGGTVTTLPAEERSKITSVAKAIWAKWAKDNGKEAQRLLEINTK